MSNLRVETFAGAAFVDASKVALIEPDGSGGSTMQLVDTNWHWSVVSTESPENISQKIELLRLKRIAER